MTREELIDEIKNRIGFETDNERYAMSEYEKEFYRSILNILEQESCEDCIPREYVIALLENKKRTRKEITNRIYEYVQGVSE